jgi:Lrp/AsnC family leucine-responsive transcriptional regulator
MIDTVDRNILHILQKDARTSNADIARKLKMAPSGILARVRKLEASGVIERHETRVNAKAVGRGLTAFTFVHAQEAVGSTKTGQKLAAISGVQEVHYTAGTAAYLLKLRVADTEALANILSLIGGIATVRDTNSVIVLRTIHETSEIPIEVQPPKGRDN